MAFKGDNFRDRATAAAEARKAMAEKFKAAPKPDDPRVQALAAERIAIAEARAARQAEKARQKAEEAAREAEAARLRAIEEARLAAEAAQRAIEERARQLQILADQKAARDARYAARKARR